MQPIRRVAAHAGSAYVPSVVNDEVSVVEVALANGRILRTVSAPMTYGPSSSLGISLVSSAVAVTAERAEPWRPGRGPSGTSVPFPLPDVNEYTFPAALHNIHAAPTAVRGGYVCRPYDTDSVAVLTHVEYFATGSATVLASPLDRAGILDMPRATFADGLLLIGGSTVDLNSNRFV